MAKARDTPAVTSFGLNAGIRKLKGTPQGTVLSNRMYSPSSTVTFQPSSSAISVRMSIQAFSSGCASLDCVFSIPDQNPSIAALASRTAIYSVMMDACRA